MNGSGQSDAPLPAGGRAGLNGWLAAIPSPRESLWLGVAMALLAALPFMLAAYPMMSDYPSHLARYHVMLDGGRSPWLARYYAFEWQWTANLGADILIWPLAKVIGLEAAGRLIGAAIPPLTALALMSVEWVLRRRIGVGSLLAMATIWSPAMAFGFYNFCLALALALFAFALWVRLEGRRWRWALLVPVSCIVWLCHMAGWGVLGLMVFGYEWQRRKGLAAFLAPWPLTLPFAAMLAMPAAAGSLNYGNNVLLYKSFVWMRALRVHDRELDLAALVLIVLTVLAAAFFRKLDCRLGWAMLIVFVGTFAIPRHLGGGDYADYRLIAVCLMLGCLAIDLRAPRWVLLVAPALFLVRIADIAVTWRDQSREMTGIVGALDHLPQGARVAGAIWVNPFDWPLNPFEHTFSWATVRRDALVNSHFAVKGVHMLTLREGGPGFDDPSQRIFRFGDERLDLATFAPAKQADYLWFIGETGKAGLPPGAVVIYRTEGSLLARLANPPPPR